MPHALQMKRNLPWALVAIFPFVVVLAAETVAGKWLSSQLDGWLVVVSFVLLQLAVFGWSIVTNPRLDNTKRTAWLVVAILLFPFGALVYWWVHSKGEEAEG